MQETSLPIFKVSCESKGDKFEYHLQHKHTSEKIIRSLHKYLKCLQWKWNAFVQMALIKFPMRK